MPGGISGLEEKDSRTALLPRAVALARVAACESKFDRQYAFSQVRWLPGRELLAFVAEVSKLRGWGRGLQRAVAAWYNARLPERILADAQQTPGGVDGWTHARILKTVRPVPASLEHDLAFQMLLDADRRAKPLA